MSLVPMKRIEIVAMQRDAKKIVETLQRQGVVDISDLTPNAPEDASVAPTSPSIAQLDRHITTTTSAIATLESRARIKKPLLSGFAGRSEMLFEDFSREIKHVDDYYRIALSIETQHRLIDSERASIAHTYNHLQQILPWQSLDIPMQYSGTEKTVAFIGTLQGLWSDLRFNDAFQEAYGKLYNSEETGTEISVPPYLIEWVHTSKMISNLCLITHKSDASAVESTLRTIGFIVPTDPTSHPPKHRIDRLKSRIKASEDAISQAEIELSSYVDHLPSLYFLLDYLNMRMEKYRMLDHLLFTQKAFVLSGYVPSSVSENIRSVLECKFDIVVDIEDPAEDELVPAQFSNNILVSPVEDIVMTYSPPTRKDIDPNPVMSFFYYLFFGVMLSDAGYGLLLALGTFLVLRIKKPEGTTRKSMLMFMYCGLSSVVWGLLFGSFFGNAVYAIGHNFFNSDVALRAFWFNPVEDPMRLLIISMILGFIHILAGLALKFVNMFRHGQRLGAFFDVGLWWVVFAGFILIILNAVIPTGAPLNSIGKWLAIGGAIGLVLTQGRDKPSIPGKIMGGVASLYGISAYFSDILSYSRLMALGLVTGIVGEVFNTIGTALGSGIVRVFIFVPVFLFGHAINLGISALGAYVHTNRLQYVEFFSKFYEGGGRAYKPFATATKHFKIKEEI
ncbi:MAG: V-type ATP synthase subunit I [Clostridiaceae bacterium]|nr:V-type ATP synthase subunit I [Clostridiaceae bacterium]